MCAMGGRYGMCVMGGYYDRQGAVGVSPGREPVKRIILIRPSVFLAANEWTTACTSTDSSHNDVTINNNIKCN